MTAAQRDAAAAADRADSVAEPLRAARRIAEEAAGYADEVDREARFPREAVSALGRSGLLGACAPDHLGGLGCTLTDAVAIAETLARGCSATAMIWAMHQIQLACLVRHGGNRYLRDYTASVCHRQLLLASATSEVGTGGDIRQSRAAVTVTERMLVEKAAPTVSYGTQADGILATLRRGPGSPANDQVLVLLHVADTEFEQLSEWDGLGMRGTCSSGYRLRTSIDSDQVFPDAFETIAARTMVPFSHLLWAGCWLGIAGEALDRARSLLRGRERRAPGGTSAPAARLARSHGRLQAMRSFVFASAAAHERSHADGVEDDWSVGSNLNTVKVNVSELAVEVVLDALAITGFVGYQERSPHSVARHLRDVLSAPLMVSNHRLLTTNAGLLLTRKGSGVLPW